ncbi:hypothetical protein TNCT_616151 [Trichonephila clavata]|uniref:Uncharacterized protein n=1 Tax=Trichonephila clavata TaxID=2740835 RepID=A0A8X6J9F8_TRICU|nr:hypothetical protein TNCT_616151 [Trichonephila clavata]
MKSFIRPRQRSRKSVKHIFGLEITVAYKECILSLLEFISTRVARIQVTKIRTGDQWLQEGQIDRQEGFHHPRPVTERKDYVLRMIRMGCSAI